ncbi:MAG TPA: metallophosphoesterase, partial [Firmicutes bacterium]|nr:metallophosphoesterase [Bacillota bacterium]
MKLDFSKLIGIRYRQRVTSVEIALTDLPAAFDGLKVLQLTDLHRGTWVSERYLALAAGRGQLFAPDLIVLTGDYVSNSRYSESAAASLAKLSAPLGVYAVLGNHDHWAKDTPRIVDALEHAGITMLTNAAVPLLRDGERLWLAGIDDIWAGEPDLDAALAAVPEGEPAILLCHEPDYAPEAAGRGVILQVSGHSHGGQVRLPGLKPVLPRYGRTYPIGLMQVEGTDSHVYVSGGLGVVFPPIRFRVPPEVSVLTLRRREILAAEVAEQQRLEAAASAADPAVR